MLEHLVIAVESEAQIVDIGRVSGFMQKVCGHLSGRELFQVDRLFRSVTA